MIERRLLSCQEIEFQWKVEDIVAEVEMEAMVEGKLAVVEEQGQVLKVDSRTFVTDTALVCRAD
jgi:hypothetical protein